MPPIDLSPSGGTPFFKCFSCCLPRSPEDLADERQRDIKQWRAHQQVGRNQLSGIVEETSSGILREQSATFLEPKYYFDPVPDLDNTDSGDASNGSFEGSNQTNIVGEFWRLIVSILFLGWLREGSKKRRAIENGSATS